MNIRSTYSRQSGFTMMELMLVITVAAVLMGIAVPSFQTFAQNNRMTEAANDLLAAVHTARTESIKRRALTVVCFVTDHNATRPACNGDGSRGWIVFVDDVDVTATAATDSNIVVDVGEEVLIRHAGLEGITTRSGPVGNAGYVAYTSSGFRREITTVGTDIDQVVLCDTRGNRAARGFTVSLTGRPAITRAESDITAMGGCT